MDADHIVEILHQGKDYFLEVDGSSFKLTEEDLIISIKDKEGFVFETNKDLYVALDTHLTPELIQEGLARELVNKIQYTRKESGLEIMDRIKVFYCGDNEVDAVFSKFADYIQNETLTNSCHRVTERHEDGTTWDVNGKEVWLAVTKD
ncbi:MAG: DUF5915 domain-containing protein, partial [Candidatus Cloacimonetes bacterium]|nr:DUF5915 domain-containing protein [Candidatus Cloacimonadota bacterium]